MHWLRSMIGAETQPLKRWVENGTFSELEAEHGDQDHWSEQVHQSLRRTLLQESQARDSIRLRCQDSAACSAWSRAPPSSALGTKIPREKFQTIFRWHTGIMVLSPAKAGTSAAICQRCGEALDAFGDHAVSCSQNNLWTRHFLVQDFLLRQCRSAGIQCLREQSLLHTERREADLLIPNWSGTRPMAIDITIRHPRALGQAFLDPDVILQNAEEEKRREAQQRATSADCLFEPLVMHTWSGLSGKGSSKAFLHSLLNRIADNRPGADKQAKLHEMTQGLSCIVAAQVAEQIASAIGPWEIPVMPAWEIPLRTDEHGNGLPGVKKPSNDSYAALSRRTKQRPSQPTQARPRENTGLAHVAPEHSPAFAIPSGLGVSAALPSPMDVFPTPSGGARNEGIFNPSQSMEEDPPLNIMDLSGWSPLVGGLDLLPIPSLGAFPAGSFDSSAMLSKLMLCLTDGPSDISEGACPLGDIPISTNHGLDSLMDSLMGTSDTPVLLAHPSSSFSSACPPLTPERGLQAEEAPPPSSRTRSSSQQNPPSFQHEPYKF